MPDKIPFITDEQVKNLLPMNEAIDLMKKAFIQISQKSVAIPQRINIEMPEVNADSLIMPVYSSEDKKYGVKIVSLNQDNPSKKLPFIHAMMVLFDAENGKPLALLDAENLTAIRTGAASGLATRLLSNPESNVAAIFGAGVQAKYQLKAICEVRDIKKIFLFEKIEEKASSFKTEMENELDTIVQIKNNQTNLIDAQIICTATTSTIPVFDDKYISTNSHINAIGAYQPDKREIPTETIKRASIFVDSKDACFKEAGDLIMPLNEGYNIRVTEIGEVLPNKKFKEGFVKELTLFKSVGNAAQDLICAIHIFKKFLNQIET
ncbi:MAG: ornithine cyclodeaminase family protein [Ignavibacteria bacterium]|nr:ornithine cyclodeaminase family protein [Ignavibacteria bacterium]MBT8383654.1 ornithine cyclodeaminase family protein [Ignavibacteria bacterium]MBT8391363.1 ornithine cyclodeaminase family protein [Ignavibacteria bacterium]NNJ52919.1 ornithine cyclodeaminase family protein [Ignavibacteriaceae bacterium]NNL21718.1 ornithine cyclodeaminase family protein [Ignavibacteriaceae bacterium]